MKRTIKTESGFVNGIPAADPRITAFLGIPYAAPPVGELRWRAPQPAEHWDGVLDCHRFGKAPMQRRPDSCGNFYIDEWHCDNDIPMGEDCLTLNVWSPVKTGKEKLPVMIFIYGGAFLWGYSSQMENDGERLARRGVVAVTINYRVNAFGFFAHPELTKECGEDYCANFGFLDQKAAIEWVYRNIEAFGGDPDNITLLGQSAGSISTLAQVCTKTYEKPIIKRIVAQSAGGIEYNGGMLPFHDFAQAERDGEEFFRKAGIKGLEDARKLSETELNDLVTEHLFDCHIRPCVDGKFLEEEIGASLAHGRWAKVPVMLGSTGNDIGMSLLCETVEDFKRFLDEHYPDEKECLLAASHAAEENMTEIQKKCRPTGPMFSAQLFAMSAARSGLPVYAYLFDGEMPGDEHGAFHSSELWFMFETLAKCWRPFDGRHYDLARKMCNYWTNFARNGDPNGLDTDEQKKPMPIWRPYTSEEKEYLKFCFDIRMCREESEPTRIMLDSAAKKLFTD